MHCEMLKHTGELPIIGVNAFRNPHGDPVNDKLELARSTEEEKQNQLKRLQQSVIENSNVFEVGGQYRRNMWRPNPETQWS